jgi:hypothetical protein
MGGRAASVTRYTAQVNTDLKAQRQGQAPAAGIHLPVVGTPLLSLLGYARRRETASPPSYADPRGADRDRYHDGEAHRQPVIPWSDER